MAFGCLYAASYYFFCKYHYLQPLNPFLFTIKDKLEKLTLKILLNSSFSFTLGLHIFECILSLSYI